MESLPSIKGGSTILAEILFASVKQEVKSDRAPGLSGSQLFPCPYRLYRAHVGTAYEATTDPQAILNMEDGWAQEEQSVKRLARAGIKVVNRQARVLVGKSQVPGSTDGEVCINGTQYLWEHKALNTDGFNRFKTYGLKAFINYRCQVNFYMVGRGLKKASFMVKHKDSNDYFDTVEDLDEGLINPIIDWCDRIRLEGWVPEPKEIPECAHCHIACFGPVLDMSWIKTASAQEVTELWKKGKAYQDLGKDMEDRARAVLVGVKDKVTGEWTQRGLIGEKEFLRVDDLEVKKITSHRFDLSKQRVIEVFGPEALLKVGQDSTIESYRIRMV